MTVCRLNNHATVSVTGMIHFLPRIEYVQNCRLLVYWSCVCFNLRYVLFNVYANKYAMKFYCGSVVLPCVCV